jgi:hypothetical protein
LSTIPAARECEFNRPGSAIGKASGGKKTDTAMGGAGNPRSACGGREITCDWLESRSIKSNLLIVRNAVTVGYVALTGMPAPRRRPCEWTFVPRREARTQGLLNGVAAVAVTAVSLTPQQVREAGFDVYLRKPIDPAVLCARVQ